MWLLRDPPGLIVACFAWCIMLVALVAIWTSLSQWVGLFSLLGMMESVWFTALLVMCFWCHVAVMTTNPGTVPAKLSGFLPSSAREGGDSREGRSGEVEEDYDDDVEETEVDMPLHEFENHEDDGTFLIYCDSCNLYRPSSPWVNNCVGLGNHKFFLLLLFYASVTSVHVILLIITQWTLCSKGKNDCGFKSGQFPGRLGVWILAAGCVFGLFCSLMLVMEVYSIYLDQMFTTIDDQLSVRSGSKSKSRLERHLSVLFGTNGFQYSWFVPIAERRSHHDLEIVQGFRCHPDDVDIC